jgi:hypothetical protein
VSLIDPDETVAVVCFATLEIAAKPHGHGWHADTRDYFDITMAGGFHVSSPAGRIEGGVSLGQ